MDISEIIWAVNIFSISINHRKIIIKVDAFNIIDEISLNIIDTWVVLHSASQIWDIQTIVFIYRDARMSRIICGLGLILITTEVEVVRFKSQLVSNQYWPATSSWNVLWWIIFAQVVGYNATCWLELSPSFSENVSRSLILSEKSPKVTFCALVFPKLDELRLPV